MGGAISIHIVGNRESRQLVYPTVNILFVWVAPAIFLTLSVANLGNLLIDIAIWILRLLVDFFLSLLHGLLGLPEILVLQIERAGTEDNSLPAIFLDSIKDDVLKRLYELKTPYAILLPIPALQGQKRFPYIKDCQALIFDKRINYFKNKETKEIQKGVSFGSFYLCKDFLPRDLIFEEL